MGIAGLFAVGVSAVNAFAKGIETVSANIANSQTVGYKRARTDFSDLIPNGAAELNNAVGAKVIGAGVAATAHRLVTEQGSLTRTAEATNMAIAGRGFFIVSPTASGAQSGEPFSFTRAGSFVPNAAGELVNAGGLFLQGVRTGADGTASIADSLGALETVNINTLPTGADAGVLGELRGVSIDADGYVQARYASGETRAIYRIPLALFRNAEGLEATDETSFLNTTLSGPVSIQAAGNANAGAIEGQALETSTVDIGQEFTTLIATQRAYSSNARILSTADELYQTLVRTAA